MAAAAAAAAAGGGVKHSQTPKPRKVEERQAVAAPSHGSCSPGGGAAYSPRTGPACRREVACHVTEYGRGHSLEQHRGSSHKPRMNGTAHGLSRDDPRWSTGRGERRKITRARRKRAGYTAVVPTGDLPSLSGGRRGSTSGNAAGSVVVCLITAVTLSKFKTHIRKRFPRVWSSLMISKVPACGILVSGV